MSSSFASKPARLVFPGKQQVALETFDPGMPGPGQVRVRAAMTLMSTGTENIVFNRLFDPGTNWDSWVKYPFYPGYSMVGTVEAVGEGVETLRVGDRVASRSSHSSHAVRNAGQCYPIPNDIPFEEAVWFALAKIAFHGALVARYKLGDSVLIIGAGPIGQMSVRWTKVSGVIDILAIDLAARRMEMAKAGGATTTIATPIQEAGQAVREALGGRLPRVVIDSTGNAEVFAAALGLVDRFGTVVILGDTGTPAKQSLTQDVISRGLTIVGAHDMHSNAEWNDATIARLFFRLMSSGQFSTAGLNTHTFSPIDCDKAYVTANRDRSATMGILFDWR